MAAITRGQRADLRAVVHVLAEMLDCANDRPLVDSKLCPWCKRVLPVAEFSRDRHRADGLRHHCRRCDKAYYVARRCARRLSAAVPGSRLGGAK